MKTNHVIKDKKRLWKCSRLKEAKETQLSAISDPIVGPVLERQDAMKDIIGLLDKIGMRTNY